MSDGGLTSSTPLLISVADVNDNAPAFQEQLYRISVPPSPQQVRKGNTEGSREKQGNAGGCRGTQGDAGDVGGCRGRRGT